MQLLRVFGHLRADLDSCPGEPGGGSVTCGPTVAILRVIVFV